MTKISEYPIISNPTEDDILIGTDVNSSDVTKNFSIGSIVNLVENGGRPYNSYTALLTQSGTSAPVATVLENTIGNIVWTRYGVGNYKGTLTGAFVENKTVCPQFPALTFETNGTFTPISANGEPQLGWINAYCQNENEIFIDTYNMVEYSEWSTILGSSFFIEIRVYN